MKNICNAAMKRHIELDVHTHTIVSGHAYNTMQEMCTAASEKGLKLYGITEHAPGIPGTCDPLYYKNYPVVPERKCNVELLLGSEINILDKTGRLSLPDTYWKFLDIRIAGIHSICFEAGTREENTEAYLNAIRNPEVDIISHPYVFVAQADTEALCRAAREGHTLLEINNNALRNRNPEKAAYARAQALLILKTCRALEHPVLISSDAHCVEDIANFDRIWDLLDEAEFPDALIINEDAEAFKRFIWTNHKRAFRLKRETD